MMFELPSFCREAYNEDFTSESTVRLSQIFYRKRKSAVLMVGKRKMKSKKKERMSRLYIFERELPTLRAGM